MTALLLAALLAAQAPTNRGYYMQPTIRGNTIVFVSQGDLWEVGTDGGIAHSLTSHVAPASHPALSPDGKRVAFTGTYEGPAEAYVMSLDGELPTRLTYGGGMNVAGWSPDGQVLVETGANSTLPNPELAKVDPVNRRQVQVPLWQAAEGSYDPSGKTLFFTRLAFQGSNTKRYKGGTAQSIWKYTDGAPEAVPLTKEFTGTSKNPMVWNHRVVFLSDRDGVMNLWSMDEAGGDLKQITHSTNWDIQSASLDAGRVVYQLGADLHLLDIATGAAKALDISLASDFDQTREHWIKNPMSYVTTGHISPTGDKVVLTARGQLFVFPVQPGRGVEVSRKNGVRYRDGIFSSDGKSVYALSDETGETEWWQFPANGVGKPSQISQGDKVLDLAGELSPDGKLLAYSDKNQDLWVLDLATKKSSKVINCPDGGFDQVRWSPDSQWLAYTFPTVTFTKLMLYSVKTGQSTAVTSGRSDCGDPTWSPDGKWLYFLSDRTFQSVVGSPWGPREPEPFFDKQTKIYQIGLVKGLRSPFQADDELVAPPEPDPKKPTGPVKVEVDLDGIQSRLWEVPVAAGNYRGLRANDRRLFLSSADRGGSTDLAYVDIKNVDPALKTLIGGVPRFELSADGKKLLVTKNQAIYAIDAGGSGALDKPIDFSGWTFALEPREEWRQMFTEAWRLERDYFYDPHLHAVDWNGIKAKYAPLVERVRDRAELSNLLAQMVGELSALHTFVYGGDNRGSLEAVAVGSLGAKLVRDDSRGGYLVDRIYAGDPDYPNEVSPLARPSVDVRAGDVIESVDGVDTLSVPDISALLRNKAGRQVLLQVKDGSAGKSRECVVVPIEPGALINLRYGDWELSRRRLVESTSKGTIGYVHLRAMGSGDIAQWTRDFYPVFDRAGLIIDVRHNNGGNIDSWVLEKLIRKAWFYWQGRVGNPTWNMQWAFRGHVVVLCDENTASDGEAFTEGFRRLGIGKVIGTRTWGGEIWLSSDNVLEDNGIATAAETGVYGPEGRWLIEGHGVDPDIVVDDLPHATFLGKDAQLDAAIAYLQKEIKDHPVPVPPHPTYPNKSWKPHP